MPFPMFDRSRLLLEPLSERQNDLTLADVLPLDAEIPPFENPDLPRIAERIKAARERGAAVILMMGAHLLRRGCARFIIDLMERGLLTHVAMNGAGAIHDFEFALIGATTESVARYIKTGQFGMWKETGQINEIAKRAVEEGIGLGELIGKAIEQDEWTWTYYPFIEAPPDIIEGDIFQYRHDISVLAAGFCLNVPVTVHVSIGQDIIHQHPNCDGAALGGASYTDFLIFAQTMCNLEGGVLLNFGSAVMGPEVYLKALSMARNVARQEGRTIAHFTTAVFDLPDLGSDFEAEPPKTDPRYYYRPWKTILVRTVADGGESFYVRGDHRETFPNLWRLI
jgi:hypothetical protein